VGQVLGASAAEVQEEMRGLAEVYAAMDLEALYTDPICAVCGTASVSVLLRPNVWRGSCHGACTPYAVRKYSGYHTIAWPGGWLGAWLGSAAEAGGYRLAEGHRVRHHTLYYV
jgi:hypothetical protein